MKWTLYYNCARRSISMHAGEGKGPGAGSQDRTGAAREKQDARR